MTKRKQGGHAGFTLIEVLLVIGIITILAAIVIIAINPAFQFAQSRNAQRWSNTNTILNAIHQYSVVHKGNIPSTITTTATEICQNGVGGCSGLIDLGVLTQDEQYLVSLPIDPHCTSGYFCDDNGIHYTVRRTINNRITVEAPHAELSETISVSR